MLLLLLLPLLAPVGLHRSACEAYRGVLGDAPRDGAHAHGAQLLRRAGDMVGRLCHVQADLAHVRPVPTRRGTRLGGVAISVKASMYLASLPYCDMFPGLNPYP